MSSRTEVFLIDDNPFSLALTKKTVCRVFPRQSIRLFSSAKEALDFLALDFPPEDKANTNNSEVRPGLILSDLHMPDLDGFAFLDRFLLLPAAVQSRFSVFILAGKAEKEHIRRLFEKPSFGGFCYKPLTLEKLKDLLIQANL
jgi:CheY-like chemotaxis protein